MDFHALAAHTSVNKLKCTNCKNFLSYFPISVCPNNQNVCGRCTAPAEGFAIQNTAFETLSQFLRFPCRYSDKGCSEELLPKKVPDHERNCPFRIIPCPTYPSACKWEGVRSEMLTHCRDSHSDIFLKNYEFLIDLKGYKSMNLVEHENILLILTVEFNPVSGILQFDMYTSQFELKSKKYQGQLNVRCDNKNLAYDFVTSMFNDTVSNELSLESIKIFNIEVATGKITLGAEIEDPDKVLNLEMLSVLKCFVCADYAVPPIHHCLQNSETLCSECKPKHSSSCNSCLRSTTSTRNINLDKMANLLNYPCKYQKNGCFFVSKPERIKGHQEVCELGDFECPLKDFESCMWKGLWKNLEEHIQNTHQELVSNSTQISKQLLPQQMKCDIIKFSNQLFRLVCMRTPGDSLLWTVQVIGPCQDDFKYEIEIIDPTNKGRRLLVRQQCLRLTKRQQLFKASGDHCYFLKDQIWHFVVDQVVTFKVHIFI